MALDDDDDEMDMPAVDMRGSQLPLNTAKYPPPPLLSHFILHFLVRVKPLLAHLGVFHPLIDCAPALDHLVEFAVRIIRL